jgi:hypothetical protein
LNGGDVLDKHFACGGDSQSAADGIKIFIVYKLHQLLDKPRGEFPVALSIGVENHKVTRMLGRLLGHRITLNIDVLNIGRVTLHNNP